MENYLKQYKPNLDDVRILSIDEYQKFTIIQISCKITTHSRNFYISKGKIYSDNNLITEFKINCMEDKRYYVALEYLLHKELK